MKLPIPCKRLGKTGYDKPKLIFKTAELEIKTGKSPGKRTNRIFKINAVSKS